MKKGLSPLALLVFAVFASGCGLRQNDAVVVYTSQDQVYAEPILKRFTARTGIPVAAVYDSESVKTAGLVNRLKAESPHPQCDIFWNNEEMLTRHLARSGLLRETNGWVGVGHRSRRLVIHTNHLTEAQAPRRLFELTNTVWRGKIALAYPLFGTTSSHFLALRQLWGEAAWTNWCQGLVNNHALIVDGNSVVVKLVAQGEAWIGMTDSDDIAAGKRESWPVAPVELSGEMLLIPNTIAVIRHAPHPREADELFHFLQEKETLQELVAANALESADTLAAPQMALVARWDTGDGDLEHSMEILKQIFLR